MADWLADPRALLPAPSCQVFALKYQRMKLRHQAHDLEPSTKKKGVCADAESDLDDDWVKSHEEELEQLEIERKKKAFEKVRFSSSGPGSILPG